MTNMKKTSLAAWTKVKKDLTPRQKMVIIQLKKKPGSTIRDVAERLKVYPNVISGRFSELETLKLIKDIGTKKYPGNNQPHTKYKSVKK